MARIKQLWSDKVLEPTGQKTAAWRAMDRKDSFGKRPCEEKRKTRSSP